MLVIDPFFSPCRTIVFQLTRMSDAGKKWTVCDVKYEADEKTAMAMLKKNEWMTKTMSSTYWMVVQYSNSNWLLFEPRLLYFFA